MNHLKLTFSFLFIIFLFGCGAVKEGFENKKKTSSDEFLVEKKSPLVMPPDFDELPIPKKKEDQNEINDENIKNLVLDKKNVNKNDNLIIDQNKDFENSLLEKIKKN
tara:strand:- start:1849 stop:2169 length:321 start_codon:yes stop_codon:yes gene_type:complete